MKQLIAIHHPTGGKNWLVAQPFSDEIAREPSDLWAELIVGSVMRRFAEDGVVLTDEITYWVGDDDSPAPPFDFPPA